MNKKLSLILLMTMFMLMNNSIINAQVLQQLQKTIKPVVVSIAAKGPGALYISQDTTEVSFWMVNDKNSLVNKIESVPLQTTPATARIVEINVSDGVSGVFYADNLTFSSTFAMRIKGKLENADCPLCTVMMPLNSSVNFTWVDWLKPVGKTVVAIVNGDNISKIVAKQKEIYDQTGKTMKGIEGLQTDFVELQKKSLPDYFQQIEVSFNELNTKTQNVQNTTLDFKNKLELQGAKDEQAVKDKETALSAYTNTEFPKFEFGFKDCGKVTQMNEKTKAFTNSFKFDLRDTKEGDKFNDDDQNVNASQNTNIDKFENESLDILDDIEPCIENLIVKYSNLDNDPNMPFSETATQNTVNPTNYEALGKQMEDYALATEKDLDNWTAALEKRFNDLDKLGVVNTTGTTFSGDLSSGDLSSNPTRNSGRVVNTTTNNSSSQIALQQLNTQNAPTTYLGLQSKTESLASPMLKHLSAKSLGASPTGNVPFSYDLKKITATLVGSSNVSQSPCGSGKYFTIDMQQVSLIISTPWNDQITADGKINLIFGLSGDDCIYAKENFDVVFGNGDADEIYGGDGHDFLFGDSLGFLNSGNDKIYGGKGEQYKVPVGPVKIAFDIGNFISGDGGSDYLIGFGESDPNNKYKYRFADVIIGDSFAGNNSGNDYIDGDGGIDFLFAQRGDDEMINSQFGVFTIIADANLPGVEVSCGSLFVGHEGKDKITGTNTPTGIGLTPPGKSFGDVIIAGADDDTVNSLNGDDFIFGDRLLSSSATGNDTINAGDGTDLVVAQNGNDTVHGNEKHDVLIGNAGIDELFADDGVFSILLGGADNDTLNGDEGFDLEIGGTGSDTIFGKGGAFDLIVGWDGADNIFGGNGIDAIFSNDGRDKVDNGDGVIDLTFAGKDPDTVLGGNGVDVIFGMTNLPGEDKRCGEKPNEGNIEKLFGGDGVDMIFGGMGHDEIRGGNGPDLLFGQGCDDFVYGENSVDFAFGNEGDDVLDGGDFPDALFGSTGFDKINGGNSSDLIFAGDGNDTASGGDGNDLIFGGIGDDILNGNESGDLIFGRIGADTIQGGDGLNILIGDEDRDIINGGNDSDVILGKNGNDDLFGNGGSDVVIGNNDNDLLDGGNGTNLLLGFSGNDTLRSGVDDDLMFGFGGADTFIVSNNENGTNVSFGNDDNDTFNTAYGRNFSFGNAGSDDFDLCDGGSPDKRDFGFGGSGSNSFNRDGSNYKDWVFGGSKTNC